MAGRGIESRRPGRSRLAIMLLMSVASRTIILVESLRHLVQLRHGRRFMRQFRTVAPFDDPLAAMPRRGSNGPFTTPGRERVAAETDCVRQRVGTLGEPCKRSELLTRPFDADPRIFWNDEATLPQRLSDAAQRQPRPGLPMRADEATRYERLAAIMSDTQGAGIARLGFVALPGRPWPNPGP